MVTEMPSPRRIDCHYLISAWSPATSTPTVEPTIDEHALLYQAAGALMTSEPLVPRKVYAPDPLPVTFPAVIADAELPTQLLPPEGFPKMAEFWGTFGAVHPWKPMLYLLVTLPVFMTEEIAGPMVTMRITEYRQAGSAQPGEIFAQIGGTITAAGQPVAGAWVRIEEALGATLAATSTAEDGRFTFGALQPGTFVIRVRATGFTEASRTVEVPSPSGNYDFQIT
jgi:hypothetical protein